MWYPIKSPFWLHWLYPRLTWHHNRNLPHLFLTFDDGPIPDVTPKILNILKAYGVQSTFFCVGDNIRKHPNIFQRILDEGHRVGNHTYNHLKGWETPNDEYIRNIEACNEFTQTDLFRPPYGRGTKTQYLEIEKKYKIIMWDVMSGDFDVKISPEQCLKNVLKHTENGSIVVFHDNLKAADRVLYALPRAIEYWLAKGYSFKTM